MKNAASAPNRNPGNSGHTPARGPAVIVAGPTGVGKSVFAVELARRLGGEIVGADAFQIYRGMAVLTAQPPAELLATVPHHLIGTASPAERFDAKRYAALADAAVRQVRERGNIPILTGGSGLYLRTFTHGLDDDLPSDPRLRAALAERSLESLVNELRQKDPEAAADIDLKNPRRVARALELRILGARPLRELRGGWERAPREPFIGFLLTREREELRARIAANVERMFAAGVIDEVRRLGTVGATAAQAIGLREIREHLAGRLPPAECMEAIIHRTRQYAKRQLTWFRRQTSFEPLNVTDPMDCNQALELLLQKGLRRNAP